MIDYEKRGKTHYPHGGTGRKPASLREPMSISEWWKIQSHRQSRTGL